MLEKLKNFAQTAQSLLLYVIAPLIILFAYIKYLLDDRSLLEQKLKNGQLHEEIATSLKEKEKVTNEANNAESDYVAARDSYLSHLQGRDHKD